MEKPLEPSEILAAVDRVAASPEWAQTPRLAQFLRFVVEEMAAGNGSRLKETVVGAAVFGRAPDYDPKLDPIVRVEARRVRLKLLEYYAGSGINDEVRIEIPKGSYQPKVTRVSLALPVQVQAPASSRSYWKWGVAAVGLMAVLGAVWLTPKSSPDGPEPPRLLTTQHGYSRTPVFSPDGERIAFSRETDDFHSHIYVVPAAGGEPTPVTQGQVADYFPAWSPDGRAIAFVRVRKIGDIDVIVRALSEQTERVVARTSERGPIDWTPDGKGVFISSREAPDRVAAIALVDLATGSQRRITNPPPGVAGSGDGYPRVSPDGRTLAFLRLSTAGSGELWVLPTSGGNPHLVTASAATVQGFAWNPTSTALIASLSRPSEVRSLWQIPIAGGAFVRLPYGGIEPTWPASSSKGSHLAFVSRISDTNIWRVELNGGKAQAAQQVTKSIALDTSPQLSPDARSLAWRCKRSGFDEIWVSDADGDHARQLTFLKAETTGCPRWSPDGKRIVFESRLRNHSTLYSAPLEGGKVDALTESSWDCSVPSWSRDGRHIYFASNRTGQWQVWRMNADGSDAQQITRQGGFAAFESYDGRSIYYGLPPDQNGIRRVAVEGGPETIVTNDLTGNLWGQWSLSERGIFYAVYGASGPRSIRRLDLASGRVADVLPLQKLPVQWDSGMSVSKDEKWLAWSQLDQAGSDIYVLDQVRLSP